MPSQKDTHPVKIPAKVVISHVVTTDTLTIQTKAAAAGGTFALSAGGMTIR